jgi:translocation and assembly module TamA
MRFSIAGGCLLFVALAAPLTAFAAKGVQVTIDGIGGELADNVRAMLSIVQDYQKKKPPERAVERMNLRAPDEIRAALQPFGYYDPRIDTRLTARNGGWHVIYRIAPGPPTLIGKLDVRVEGPGRDNAAIRRALKSSRLVAGQRLIQSRYADLKQALLKAAQSAGYVNAKYVRHEILVHPQAYRADIHLVLDTGPRFYFGTVTVEQNILDPAFVARFIDIKPGDPFSTDRLLDLELKLRASDYFNQIVIDANKSNAKDHRIPVVLHPQPTAARKYSASIGYGTDTGPRVGAGILFRHLNRYGHQFRADLQWSAIRTTLHSQYKIPFGDPAREFYDFGATAEQIDINDSHSKRASLGAGRDDDWLGGHRRWSLDYERETFHFGDEPGQATNLLIPGVTYTRKRADNPLFPRRGYWLSVNLHGAAQQVLSDVSFLSIDVATRGALPLGPSSRLLLYAEMGAIKAADFNRLPPSERFFAGGARSVRGYGYEELAPRDAAGNIVGGRFLEAASVEFDHLIAGNWGAAAFFDTGNVANNLFPSLRHDVGLGLRYRTPIGMIRVDIARTLNDPGGNHYRLQVSIGPDF